MKVVAIVGMAGAGKSEVSRVLEKDGFKKVRFGDITDQEIMNSGMELNEESEHYVRQQLRKEHGMAAYAKLNLPRIDALLKSSDVAVDGLYSWEEYDLLKRHYGESFWVVAVWASPGARYLRLSTRRERPLTLEEAASRDRAEIEEVNKSGPIKMVAAVHESVANQVNGQLLSFNKVENQARCFPVVSNMTSILFHFSIVVVLNERRLGTLDTNSMCFARENYL